MVVIMSDSDSDYIWMNHWGKRIRIRVRASEGSRGDNPTATRLREIVERRREQLRRETEIVRDQAEKLAEKMRRTRDAEFNNFMAGSEQRPKRLKYGIIEAHWYLKNLDNWHVHRTFDLEDEGRGFIPFVPDLANDLGVETLVKMRSGPWRDFKKSKYPRISHPLHNLVLYAGRTAFEKLRPHHLEAYFSQKIKTRAMVTVADAFRIRHDLPPIHEPVETPVMMTEADLQMVVDGYIDEGELATSLDFVKPEHKNLVSTTPVESDTTLRDFMGDNLERQIVSVVKRMQQDSHCDMLVVALVNDTLLKKFGGPIQIDPPL